MRTSLLDRFGYRLIQTGGMKRKAMVFVVRSTRSFRDRLGIQPANGRYEGEVVVLVMRSARMRAAAAWVSIDWNLRKES
jgi:hypothetical protein